MLSAGVLAIVFLSFLLSSSAGMGGSLILVPALSLLLGAKQGVAVAAVLLALNNVGKVVAYRKTLALRQAAIVLVLTIVGAALGAAALTAVPETWVSAAVIIAVLLTLLGEQLSRSGTLSLLTRARQFSAPGLALGAGMLSGFAGTSGPLKGLALRCLNLDRQQLVGAASVVSFGGDAMKAAVFLQAGLLVGDVGLLAATAIPLAIVATLLGWRLNQGLGERGYAVLFWAVMIGYCARLVVV